MLPLATVTMPRIPIVASLIRGRGQNCASRFWDRCFSTSTGILHHEWVSGGKISKHRPAQSDTDNGPKSTVVFLHGLLGSGKNLRMPAKRLTRAHPSINALLIDLRGHGNTSASDTLGLASSDGATQQNVAHTLESCADDVVRTVKDLGMVGPLHSPVGIVGHSFGGRTALQYLHSLLHASADHPDEDDVHPPLATYILDAVPGEAHASVADVVDKVSSVGMPIGSKKELISELMENRGVGEDIALWMTTNLIKSPCGQGFNWTFDLDVARGILDDFPQQNFVELAKDVGTKYVAYPDGVGSGRRKSKIEIVMAGKNEAWTPSVIEELQGLRETSLPSSDPFLNLHLLPDAGHNVHVDDLEGLMRLLEDGFRLS